MKKILVTLIGFAFLASIGIIVSAQSGSVTDPIGDVMHWRHTDTTWGWETDIGNKPNIDVTEISYEVSGNQFILSFKVDGTIIDSDLVAYWAYLNTSDSNYFFNWVNGEGIGWGVNTEEGSFQMDYEPDIVASGNTITATFDLVGTFTSGVDLWGWAVEYTTYGNTMDDWWADWAPNEESPYYEQYRGEDDPEDPVDDPEDPVDDPEDPVDDPDQSRPAPPNGTPGFELFALITAFAAVVLIIKKRK
ncbi:MAG: hypothetical protein QCI00_07710 [Candidatus Thermoplasmatota archaeon]|nr:hypothetical protein [Candidatus Thermoplasmatota archaeon]